MKSLFVFAALIILTTNAFTKEAVHREHSAHKHGSGALGIAFDDLKGRLEFRIPSESIIGFEYKAKSKKDIATQKNQLDKLEKNISEIVSFESLLKCKVTNFKTEVVPEKENPLHSETLANVDLLCEKSPLNTKITFNFQKYFPKIKDIDIQVLIGNLQKSIEATKSGLVLELN